MTIQVWSADGVRHDFEDGTDDAVIDKAMLEYVQAKPAGSPEAAATSKQTGQVQSPFSDIPNAYAPSKPPTPPPTPVRHVVNAVADAFRGPYGPSQEPVNVGAFPEGYGLQTAAGGVNALAKGGLTALDVLGRPLLAAKQGLAAVGGEVARAIGSPTSTPEQAERDLNMMGDMGLILGGQEPWRPKMGVGITETAANTVLGQPARNALQWVLGSNKLTPEQVANMHDIYESGGRVPVESFAPDAARLAKIQDIVRPWYDPVGKAAEQFYPGKAAEVERAAGVPPEQITNPLTAKEAPATAEAGAGAVAKATELLDTAKGKLDDSLKASRAAEVEPMVQRTGEAVKTIDTEKTRLTNEANEASTRARQAVDNTLAEVNKRIEQTLPRDEAQSGALIQSATKDMSTLRRSMSQYFNSRYDHAVRELPAGEVPDVSSLGPLARDTLQSLIPGVREQYPNEVKWIAKLAGEDKEAGPVATGLLDEFGKPIMREAAKEEAEPVTLAQLHQLRSWLRHAINYDDLAPGVSEKPVRDMQNAVNSIIHDEEASPNLQAAARELDTVDNEYRQQMPRFTTPIVRAVVKSGQAANPVNATRLAGMVITPENTEQIRMVKGMVTPETWSQMQAAHLRSMLRDSRAGGTGDFNPRAFAADVVRQHDDGMLGATYGEGQANDMLRLARQIQQTHGTFDVNVLPGDTITDLLARSQQKLRAAEELGSLDPLGVLKDHVKQVDVQIAEARKAGNAQINADMLNEVADAKSEAAFDTIFKSPDLLREVHNRFTAGGGEAEWQALQQAWLKRWFQRPLGETRDFISELRDARSGMTRDIQEMMFPGVSLDKMQRLADQMKLIFPRQQDQMASGLMRQGMVAHPENFAFIPKNLKHDIGIASSIPGIGPSIILGMILPSMGKLVGFMTNKPTFDFVMRGLDGSPIERDAARVSLLAALGGVSGQQALMAGSAVLSEHLRGAGPRAQQQDQPEPIEQDWLKDLGGPTNDNEWLNEIAPPVPRGVPATPQQHGMLPKPPSPAHAMRLPPGTPFVLPDGTLGRVPVRAA